MIEVCMLSDYSRNIPAPTYLNSWSGRIKKFLVHPTVRNENDFLLIYSKRDIFSDCKAIINYNIYLSSLPPPHNQMNCTNNTFISYNCKM